MLLAWPAAAVLWPAMVSNTRHMWAIPTTPRSFWAYPAPPATYIAFIFRLLLKIAVSEQALRCIDPIFGAPSKGQNPPSIGGVFVGAWPAPHLSPSFLYLLYACSFASGFVCTTSVSKNVTPTTPQRFFFVFFCKPSVVPSAASGSTTRRTQRGGLGPRAFVNFLRDLLGSKAHPGCCVLRHVAAAGVVVGGCGFAPCVVAGWWGSVVFFVAVLGGQPQAQHAEDSLCVRPYYGEYT